MKKPVFLKEICVRREHDEDFHLICGEPKRPDLLDADDGDLIAVYRLVRVTKFRTNAKLTNRI